MGGCRCTFRNCTAKSDGSLHMFHYPVFDKSRCYMWLLHANKLEYLNLKLSQLRNRVVCQHHFIDGFFMNYMKDKLRFNAIPTENGPFCDPNDKSHSQINPDGKKFLSLMPDEFEDCNEIDKKAVLSKRYFDFLTNYEFGHDTAIDETQKVKKELKNETTYDELNLLRRNALFNNIKTTVYSEPKVSKINYQNQKPTFQKKNNTIDERVGQNNNPLLQQFNDRLCSNDSNLMTYCTPQEQKNQQSFFSFQELSNQNNTVLQQNVFSNVSKLTNIPRTEIKKENEQSNNQMFLEKKQSNIRNKTSSKVKILSLETLATPVIVQGPLETVPHNFILNPPNKNKEQKSEITHTEIMPVKQTYQSMSSQTEQTKIICEQSNEIIKENKKPVVATPTLNPSQNVSKLSPQKVADIDKKRKFNMKMRDIIEASLNKLDEDEKTKQLNKKETEKSDLISPKVVSTNVLENIDKRLQKMEEAMISKINENSQQIIDLKNSVLPMSLKSMKNDESYKKYLYQEISQFLSPNANSLIYEELFINKYTESLNKQPLTLTKKRRRR